MKKILLCVPVVTLLAAIMLFGQGNGDFFGVKTAFGYGAGGPDKTIALNTPNGWTVVSPSTMLSDFDYTSADISSILTYDANAKAFIVPSASDLLDPLNAFYIKPNKGTSVFLTYETFTPGQTSKNLSSGWNFVGTNTNGPAIDEFSTIQSSVSTLYVPGTDNGKKDITGTSWGIDANRDLDKTSWTSSKVLNALDGYWVYLTGSTLWTKILN